MKKKPTAIFGLLIVISALAATPPASGETMSIVDGGQPHADSHPVVDFSLATDVVSSVPEPSATRPGGSQILGPEKGSLQKATTPSSGSEVLGGLDAMERTNAVIRLEPFGDPSELELLRVGQVEELWTSSRFDEAIDALEELEGAGSSFAVSISWKQPVATESPKVYPDVQVSSRTMGDTASIDYHGGSGTILVLVVWDSGWTVNISTDDGQSFSETHYWSGYPTIADMSVSGDHAWVGYSASADDYNSARFRRFHADTGLEDDVYDYEIVANESPNTMTEIRVVGNTPDNHNRIFMTYLVAETDSIKFWWDDLAGTTFSEVLTGITDAHTGHDFTWNPHYPTDHARWISYISTGNLVMIYRNTGSGFEPEISYPYSGIDQRTSISAFNDNIYCAVQCETDPGLYGVCYLTSSDAGAGSWMWDDAYYPTGSDPTAYRPDISVRSGLGRAVVFSSETGALDDVYTTTRRGWTPGLWTDPAWINSWDHLAGDHTFIEWIGVNCVSSYGVVYFDEAGPNTPYFDVMTERGFFCDGFEGGTTGAWD